MLAAEINRSHIGMTYKTGRASKMRRRVIEDVDVKSSYVALKLRGVHGGLSWTILDNSAEVEVEQ